MLEALQFRLTVYMGLQTTVLFFLVAKLTQYQLRKQSTHKVQRQLREFKIKRQIFRICVGRALRADQLLIGSCWCRRTAVCGGVDGG